MKAVVENRIVEVILDSGLMNVVLMGRAFADEVIRHYRPIRTADCTPDAKQVGAAVFAWSDTYHEFVIAPSKSVAENPKAFTHWLPRAVIPEYRTLCS